MTITANLIACGVGPTQARAFAEPIQAAFSRFGITLLAHRAAFLAQALHESQNLTKLEESTFYSSPERIHAVFARLRSKPLGVLAAGYVKKPQALANLAYAHINGNGDEASCDGWRYRGRGLFHLTGRTNYEAAGNALGKDLLTHPELVALPEGAAMTAGWFWTAARLSDVMSTSGIDAVSRRVNGGSNGLVERRDLFAACVRGLAA